ncbi:class C sortase [Propionimicrobium lymphophilum]|uniref:class C sortase n=1 Tax=Propionimicrobium lymphophilum TaxID=33012 RepID=UPI0025501449|nr:class C sortase [Propionimicrobium lymphophilum]MDK7710621.1 class C sortase [Propionimicrobium lymphophilum]MDK7734552.1 class C sortase [Propionimicrobium lymphophilum]
MRKFLAATLLLIGMVCLLYPTVAIFAGNLRSLEVARAQQDYQTKLAAQPDRSKALLDDARAYNSTLSGIPILDPYLHRMSAQGSRDYEAYLSTLPSENKVMGRLVVPSASIDLPIRHGTDDDAIAHGAGHLFGTGLPVGGVGVNAVLTAHSGLTTASLFDGLRDVKVGDRAFVQVGGQTLAYEVFAVNVIEPTDLKLFEPDPNRDILTLFTCTPYGINTHRLVVSASRVELGSDDVSQLDSNWTDALRWWMIAPPAVCVGVLVLVVAKRGERA